ncbi:ZIP family metal transporter [Pseudoduganella namucuonensis]|uniref:Zinc and cadmium transporter n=1 Tax=Pseudoduganella namucuonensis TaxID=1035707 RepID=A0A1I7LPI8_9BURK|nr:ZIP family metal transporter [Pseudoduganella namucuonensis]SFV11603.1 zinc and cadmium transporter [Pseudoduganella namucuonensis]
MASISAAAFFSFTLLSNVAERMLSLSAGVMLATSLLHALPDAVESGADPHRLFATVLAGLLAFFFLEKFAILRHGDDHHAHSGQRSGWMVLAGDALHNFTDGIMIAASFLADPGLGILTGLAIAAHEIPQEIGDFVVLLDAGYTRARAYLFNLLCSLMAVAGGLLGYFTLGRAGDMVPYVLAFASAGFIYIAVSHLMPRLQREETVRGTVPQLMLMSIGVGVVLLLAH